MKTKTLIKSPESKINPILFPVLLLTLALLTAGSSVITTGEMQNDLTIKEKKLNLLEKLERGDKISPDEIRSSFSCDLVYNGPFIPSSEEFDDLFDDLKMEMEEIGKHMGNIHESEELNDIMEGFRIQREEIRHEIERVREEIRKARIEIREIDFETIM